MSTQPAIISSVQTVSVAKPIAQLLQHEGVMVHFLGELMDLCLCIDRNSIASGSIQVTQGDPSKVSEVIDSIVGEIDVHAEEADEEVLKVLNLLKEKFPAQTATDFERSTSTFKVAFHRNIRNAVEPDVISLATKSGRFPLSRQHINYLQCHLERLQDEVYRAWPESAVSLDVQKDDKGWGSLQLSSKRLDFQAVKNFLDNLIASTRKFSKDLKPSCALFLCSATGQKEVRRIEKEDNCRITVHLPGHQLLVRAESPTGHRLFLCEGNMAATDCSVLLLPFSENQRDWTNAQKLILDRGLLTTKTELYAKCFACPPHPLTLRLHSQRPDVPHTVVLIRVSDHLDCASALTDGLGEALQLSRARGAGIAGPIAMKGSSSLGENLKCILPIIQRSLDQEEHPTTLVLYLEKSPAAVRRNLVEILEQTVDSHWKVETDVVAVYEENSSSSPTLVVVGQMEDAGMTCDKVQTIDISCECKERSGLLEIASKTVLDISTVPWATVPSLGQENDPRVTFAGQFMEKRDESEVGDHDAENVFKRGHTVAEKSVQEKEGIPPHYYKDSVLVTGIPEGTSEDCLQNFLESVADVGVEAVQFSKAKGKAMICFGDTQVDLKFLRRLHQACQDNPLSGGVLSVHCIPLSDTVLVRNLNSTTTDSAILYFFSNKTRNSGGLVSCVTRLNTTTALVRFENQRDAQAVVDKESHVLDEFPLKVSLHLECFPPVGGCTPEATEKRH